MDEEMSALHQNQTWWIEKHTVGCKWVNTVKYHADGSVSGKKVYLNMCGLYGDFFSRGSVEFYSHSYLYDS